MSLQFKLTLVTSAVSVVAVVSGLVAPSVFAEEWKSGRTGITRTRDLKRPTTSVKDWMAQMEAATVQVTKVQLDRTETGLEITLETAAGKPLQVDATKFRIEGNSLIADIPNAVLALSESQAFAAENPTTDIATVQVVQRNANTIRVSVMGKNALPKTDVTLKTGAFAHSLSPEAEEPDEEIVVTGEGQRGYRVPNASTATKTDTPIRDIPQSIQVVPRQVIEDQKATQVGEALRNVSGVSTNIGSLRAFADSLNIRGFSSSDFYIDGFRDNFLLVRQKKPLVSSGLKS